MQWISEKDLEDWSRLIEARATLIAMVADLIRATAQGVTQFRFPSGSAAQVRGWDGDLTTSTASGFVPEGDSKWEFGTSPGASKASSDYKKRTDQTNAKEMSDNTLVLVNLMPWDTPRVKITDWLQERRDEKKWKDIKYIDGVQLVHWLNEHPAVAAKYAREVLRSAPKEDALSTDEYWEEFSTQYRPQLSEKVVIAGRISESEDIVEKLLGGSGSIVLGSETTEEAVAFAVASIRNAPADKREILERKTLIVRTTAAARHLQSRNGLAFIVMEGAESLAGTLALRGPTLSVTTGATAKRGKMLSRASATGMVEGFVEMGLDHNQGYELARRCGRSLTILKRLIFNKPVDDPIWLPHAIALRSTFLAGGWSRDLDLDRAVMKDLGGYEGYEQLETLLAQTMHLPDRPFDREGDIWQVRAPVDAFHFYGGHLGESDLGRFRDALIKVFSKQVEIPKRDQKFNPYNAAPDDYSKWLRDGLALTLLIIACMHDVTDLHIKGMTPQEFVNDVVSSLPDWGKSHHSILRLADQTSLLAEAAPNPFLVALESILEGKHSRVSEIFHSNDDDFLSGSTSAHVHFLWALETIAWDPKYLPRAALALAKLAEIDPDPESNLINRPLNSLREIFLGWSPSTYANQIQRIASIDQILKECPSIGWKLISKLLPRYHDSSSSTRRPKLRDLVPEQPEEITFGLVWDFEDAMVSRVLSAAGADESRVSALVESLGQLQPKNRTRVIAYLDAYLSKHPSAEGNVVWHLLKDEAAKNEYFSDAEWSIKEDLGALKDLVDRHQPSDPLVSERHAFDEWSLHVGTYDPDSASTSDPDNHRKEVLQRVLDRDGVQGVLRLAGMVKIPELLGQTIWSLSLSQSQLYELLNGFIEHELPPILAYQASAAGAARFGDSWIDSFASEVLVRIESATEKARLLLGWPMNRATWSFAESIGEEVHSQYWQQSRWLPIDASYEDLAHAISQFQKVGRDIDVFAALHGRVGDLPSGLLIELLGNGVGQLSGGLKNSGSMLSHYIARAFAVLRERGDATPTDIARLEYSYFPLLRREKEPTVLSSLMASQPETFVEVLSHVYRSKDAPADQTLNDDDIAKAKNSYHVLDKFKTIPGLTDRVIDLTLLMNWVLGVRELAAEKGLDDIADQRIGYVLARTPVEDPDQAWPPSAICEVIEAVAADQLERGFAIECFNKRGVYSKGINEGGDQERALATRYANWARLNAQYPRTATMLHRISESWTHHAKAEDLRAEQEKMRI